MNQSYGRTFRKLREEKGLSQTAVASNHLSRSLVAKFENDDVIPSMEKFRILLQQIDVSYEEFFFICEEYHYTYVDPLRKKFFATLSNAEEKSLVSLIDECDKVLDKKSDLAVLELKNIILAMIELLNNRFDQAIQLATPVWNRISKSSNWSLTDIRLLNCIFYIFSIDEAIHVVYRAIDDLARYENFLPNKALEMRLKLNLVALMMNSERIDEETLNLLEDVLVEAKKEKDYEVYAAALFRRGACKLILHNNDGENDMQTALAICDIFEEKHLKKCLLEECQLYLD